MAAMKKIKSSVLGELPQLLEDLRRHYIPYIDLCRFRGKTRWSDTFHVLTGVDKSSIRLVGTKERERESFPKRIENSPEQPATLGQTFAIYFLQRAERIFSVFTAVELFFTLPR